jgi:hypothetical protein
MILYNFDIQNGKVRIYESSNDSEIELSNPFIDRQNTLILIYSDSVLVKKLSFIEFGTVDGVVPTNLDNAGDLINALIDSVSVRSEQQTQTEKLTEISNSQVQPFGYSSAGSTRVTQMTTLLDGKVLNADDADLFENVGTGTATFTGNKINLAVTNGQYLIRQSKRFMPYFSGKPQVIEITCDNFHGEVGKTKRIGYFSSNAVAPYDSNFDGCFIEDVDGVKTFYIYNNGTIKMSKAFTDMDNYDAISGVNYQNFNVFAIDFLWLGGAVLRFFVKTQNGFILAHTFNYSTTAQDTFMLSPNQPIRYEIRSTSGTGSLRYVCCQVATEGSFNEAGKTLGIFNLAGITTNTLGTIFALKGVKKQTVFRDIAVQILNVEISNTASADAGILLLIKNPTISAPLTYVNKGVIQEGTASSGQTITANTGVILCAVPVGASGGTDVMRENFLSFLSQSITNTMDEYVLAYTPITNNQVVHGVINVKSF